MLCAARALWFPGPRVDDAGWAEWLIAHEGSEFDLLDPKEEFHQLRNWRRANHQLRNW